MGIGIDVDTLKNKGNNDLWHIDEQEDIKDPFGLIPHCIHPQDHDHCNVKALLEEVKSGGIVTHNQQQQRI